MFEIKKDIKEFIKREKENLKPRVILNLVKDTITQMLSYNLPKSYILNFLNTQLETNINYQTFNSYIRKLKKEKNISSSPLHDTKNTSKNTIQNDFLGVV